MASTTNNGLDRILAGNKTFARRTTLQNPDLFPTLGRGQSPEVLWLGCADSRIPETTVCDCQPGDIFVHRNIANVIAAKDLSAASVIEYAVAHLKVQRIIVCGHTKCGGANAAMSDGDLGPTLNAWLEPIRELRRQNKDQLDRLATVEERTDRLAELNVRQSLEVVKANPVVANAIKERGLTVHGLIYDIPQGELKSLDDSDPVVEIHSHN